MISELTSCDALSIILEMCLAVDVGTVLKKQCAQTPCLKYVNS